MALFVDTGISVSQEKAYVRLENRVSTKALKRETAIIFGHLLLNILSDFRPFSDTFLCMNTFFVHFFITCPIRSGFF